MGWSFQAVLSWEIPGTAVSQARKRHININIFVRLVLGENLGQTRVFSLFYTLEARIHRACPWDKPGLSLGQTRGRRAAQKVHVKKVYEPLSLASESVSGVFPKSFRNFFRKVPAVLGVWPIGFMPGGKL